MRIIKTRPDAPKGSIEFGPIGNERSVYERDDSGEIENIYDLLSNVCCDGGLDDGCCSEDWVKCHCKDGWVNGLEVRDELNELCVIDGREVTVRNGLRTDKKYYVSLTLRIDLHSCAQWNVFRGMEQWGKENVGKFFSVANSNPEKRSLPRRFNNLPFSGFQSPPGEKDPTVLFSHMRYFSDEFSWFMVFTRDWESNVHPLYERWKDRKTTVVIDDVVGMYGIDTLIWHKHDCDWDITGEKK